MAKIADYLSETEILAQLAEEAAELAQAALKLRRAIDGTNPTPKNREECGEVLVEEYADVAVCANALENSYFNFVPYYYDKKKERWLKRLQENGAPKTDKVDVIPVKHGKWIADDSGYGDDIYACSVCKDGFVLETGTPKKNNMRYCPNCGAKMDVEE